MFGIQAYKFFEKFNLYYQNISHLAIEIQLLNEIKIMWTIQWEWGVWRT
jgi:hypothetical protein